MKDEELIAQIGALVEEEHRLESRLEGHGADADAGERLRQLEVSLDQCWDLLRQRRARRNAGGDPDQVAARPPTVVEDYQQ
jgi:hypothetical protein